MGRLNVNNSKLIDNIFLAVIAVIFLIFLLYKPEYDCIIGTNYNGVEQKENYTNNTQYSITDIEQEDINQSFGTEFENVILVVDRAVNKIVDYTEKGVVTPCMTSNNITGLDNRIRCIIEYKHYFTDVLKYPITDMFNDLDRLNIDPFRLGTTKKYDQQYEAVVRLVRSFIKSLEGTLAILKTKYSTFGYISKDFKMNFIFVLKQEFVYGLMEIFRDPDKKWSSIDTKTNTSPTKDKDEIIRTPITMGNFTISCSDLESGNLNIHVDGTKLMCK